MLKAYRYRLYPNKEQLEKLKKHFDGARHVYNWALEQKKDYYDKHGKTLFRKDLQEKLVVSKKNDKKWLNEVNSQSLLSSLMNLDKAFSSFFRKKTGFPRFKSKKNPKQSFQCPQHVTIDQKQGRLSIPKIKGIKIKVHRPFIGKIKTCTITKTPKNHYYISVLVEDDHPLPSPSSIQKEKSIGVDLGLSSFVITDKGTKYENKKFLEKTLKRLKKRQRQLSRCKKGSANRNKKRVVLCKVHDKVAKQREWYHHHISNALIHDNQVNTIAFEDLHVKGMIKNRKLARHIADVGWSSFVSIVRYKAAWIGKNVIFCSRFDPSSKTCHNCGDINKNLKLSDRKWTCVSCDHHHDRDINAAQNIKKFAIADAVGQTVCVKQSPCGDRFSKPATAKGRASRSMGRKKPPLEQLAV